MAIRDILVHLDQTPRAAARLALATALATQCRAHLTGLYVTQRPVPASDRQTGAAMTAEGFRGWLGQRRLEGAWRLENGSSAAALARFGRCSDLTVLGQHDPQEGRGGLSERELVGVLRSIGRPVLAVPYAGSFASIGKRVLVLWQSGPESTRALHEALPLLCDAKAVQVLVSICGRQPDVDTSGAGRDVLCHLSRHGVVAQGGRFHTDKGIDAGEAMLSYAADYGADLMVAGASLGTRVGEMIFGSSALTILRKMTVPVLLSN